MSYLSGVGDRTATPAPWLCTYSYYGCNDTRADNFVSYATVSYPSLCEYGGCNDTDASNFNPSATYNDGSCQYELHGCTVCVRACSIARAHWLHAHGSRTHAHAHARHSLTMCALRMRIRARHAATRAPANGMPT